MMLRKNRAVIKPARIELNDDHKKVSSLVVLLIAIDKRMAADAHADTKRSRSKKTKKIDVGKLYREGSQKCGPLLFLIVHALSLLLHLKYLSIGKAYDRYNSITSLAGFFPNY